ncbi:MAG: YtxH domain-containing protein [Actinomycetota bacterium]
MQNNNLQKEDKAKILREILFIVVISLFSGFILGILLAPQSGSQSRKNSLIKLRDFIDRGKFTLVEAKVIGEGFLEKSKEKVEEVSSKIKNKKDEG